MPTPVAPRSVEPNAALTVPSSTHSGGDTSSPCASSAATLPCTQWSRRVVPQVGRGRGSPPIAGKWVKDRAQWAWRDIGQAVDTELAADSLPIPFTGWNWADPRLWSALVRGLAGPIVLPDGQVDWKTAAAGTQTLVDFARRVGWSSPSPDIPAGFMAVGWAKPPSLAAYDPFWRPSPFAFAPPWNIAGGHFHAQARPGARCLPPGRHVHPGTAAVPAAAKGLPHPGRPLGAGAVGHREPPPAGGVRGLAVPARPAAVADDARVRPGGERSRHPEGLAGAAGDGHQPLAEVRPGALLRRLGAPAARLLVYAVVHRRGEPVSQMSGDDAATELAYVRAGETHFPDVPPPAPKGA